MTAIKVEKLSKVYKLYDTKKDRLKEAIHPLKKKYHRDFYALKDVSFEIKKGETVGIIGKNGSGKSTLLKIITGLLTSTSGTVEVNGTVSALLELGAGFNPEYTGIENIYLNGMLMGFNKDEMDARIDKIVDFADIGEFIRQPVKLYSSGMYVRLAFAVAINVEPDILIIDEALAVGDIRFQQKCYRKIKDFRDKNKTIFFCTHDTGAVLNLCSSCFWIHDGKVKEYGDPEDIIKKYRAFMYYNQNVKEDEDEQYVTTDRKSLVDKKEWNNIESCSFFGEGGAMLTHASFYRKGSGKPVDFLKGGEKVVLGIRAVAIETLDNPIFGFNVKNAYGVNAFGINTFEERCMVHKIEKGDSIEAMFSFIFPPLANGNYSIDIAIANGTQAVHIQHCWKYDVFTFGVVNNGNKYNFGFIYVDSNKIDIIQKEKILD